VLRSCAYTFRAAMPVRCLFGSARAAYLSARGVVKHKGSGYLAAFGGRRSGPVGTAESFECRLADAFRATVWVIDPPRCLRWTARLAAAERQPNGNQNAKSKKANPGGLA